MLPSWFMEQRELYDPVTFTAPEPEWKLKGYTLSAVADPIYPYDPAVLDAIHEFWPEAVYLRRLWIYERQGKPYRFMRHALGSYLWNPRTAKPGFRVEMPVDATFPVPTQIELTLSTEAKPFHPVMPGEFVEWSWATYHYVRSVYDDQHTPEQRYEMIVQRRLDEEERQKGKLAQEWEYIKNQDRKYEQRCLDALSDVEIAEYLGEQQEKIRRAKQEKQCRLRKMRESKPLSVYLNKGEVES
jgi:hypothetical protein